MYNSFLIKSFRSGNSEKEIIPDGTVYHYTSPEGFLNIIQSKRLRFTDTKYLNDKSEKVFFLKLLFDFTKQNGRSYPKFSEIVNRSFNINNADSFDSLRNQLNYEKNTGVGYSPYRTFVFCTSKDPDSLNMWNYYVKNGSYQGYNLGISTSKILKTFDTDSKSHLDAFIVHYGYVLYDRDEQFNEIKALATRIEKREYSEDFLFDSLIDLISYIESHALFYKHQKFKSEEEYRIVIAIKNENIPRTEKEAKKYFGENNKKMKKSFYAKNGIIVPCLSIALPQNALSEVYISPITEAEIAELSIKELLDDNGFNSEDRPVIIKKSEIPIRY